MTYTGVLLHAIKDGFCLEASCFEGGTRDVPALCVRGDAEDGTFGVVDPVGREELPKVSAGDGQMGGRLTPEKAVTKTVPPLSGTD